MLLLYVFDTVSPSYSGSNLALFVLKKDTSLIRSHACQHSLSEATVFIYTSPISSVSSNIAVQFRFCIIHVNLMQRGSVGRCPLLENRLNLTCLFKTRCLPFQYLSIWSACRVLTISTGLTAVSWLISEAEREIRRRGGKTIKWDNLPANSP